MADAVLADRAGADRPAWDQVIRQTLDETGLFGAHQIDVATDRLLDAMLAHLETISHDVIVAELHTQLATVTAERDRAAERVGELEATCESDIAARVRRQSRIMDLEIELARAGTALIQAVNRAEQAAREAQVLATEWQARRDEMIAAHERALRGAEARVGALEAALGKGLYAIGEYARQTMAASPEMVDGLRAMEAALLAPPAGSAGA